MLRKLLLLIALVGCEHDSTCYEISAKRWLVSMKMNYAGVSCSARDSDGDGYVTCSVNVEPGKPLQTLLCDTGGCKPGKDFVIVPVVAPSAAASMEMR